MAKNTFSTVNVKVTASAAGVDAGLNHASDRFKSFAGFAQSQVNKGFGALSSGSLLSGIGKGMDGLLGSAKAFAGPIGAAAAGFDVVQSAVAGLFDITIGQGQKALAQAKQADALGFSRSGVAGLDMLSGGMGADLMGAMPKFNKLVGEAGAGSQEAAKKLAKFGLTAKEAFTNTPEQNLKKLMDSVAAAPSQFEKTSIAMAAFEEAGGNLLPFLDKGGRGYDAQRDKALKAMGSNELIKNTKGFTESVRELEEAWNGVKVSIGNASAPLLRLNAKAQKAVSGALDAMFGASPAEMARAKAAEDAKTRLQAAETKKKFDQDQLNNSIQSTVDLAKGFAGQRANFGMDANEIALSNQYFKMLQDGTIKSTKALEAFNRAKEDAMFVKDAGLRDQLVADIATPFERANKQLEEAKRLLDGGFINESQFGRKANKIADALDGAYAQPTNIASTIEANSKEAASFVLKARAEGERDNKDPFERLQDALKRGSDAEQRTEEAAKRIAEMMESGAGKLNLVSF